MSLTPTPDSSAIRQEPRRFRTDVALVLGSRVVVVMCGLAQTVIVARALGPTGRGAVAAAISLALILVQVGTFGLPSANPYFLAGTPSLRDRLVANSFWIAIVLGLVLAGVGAGVRLLAPGALEGLDTVELTLALAILPAGLAVALLQSLLLGAGQMRAYTGITVAVASFPVVALGIALVTVGLEVKSALGIILATHYLGFAVALQATGAPARVRRFDRALLSRMVTYSLRAYAATLVAFLVLRLDVLLMNGYYGPRATGVYTVAVALADGLYLLPVAVGSIVFARVARGTDQQVVGRAVGAVAIIHLLACAASVALAAPVIRGLFGSEFAGATELYYWLAPGVYALGVTTVLSQYFAGRGAPAVLVGFWAAGLSVNIGINLWQLPHEGPYIASLASSVAYGLVLVGHLAYFYRSGGRISLARAGSRATVAHDGR